MPEGEEQVRRDWSHAEFATTRWSVIVAARDPDSEKSRAALEELCNIYAPAVYAFARRKGISWSDAKDLTQEFFLRLFERDAFRTYSPKPGVRFRTWLLTCLKHFQIEEWRKLNTQKKGGRHPHISLNLEDEQGRAALEVPDSASPEAAYDAAIARQLSAHSFERLEHEQIAAGNEELYKALKPVLLNERAKGAMDLYAQMAKQFAMTPMGVAKRRERLQTRLGEILREEASRLVASEDDVADELRYLLGALG